MIIIKLLAQVVFSKLIFWITYLICSHQNFPLVGGQLLLIAEYYNFSFLLSSYRLWYQILPATSFNAYCLHFSLFGLEACLDSAGLLSVKWLKQKPLLLSFVQF